MKKTQFLDAIRNIRKRFISYLSVIIIAVLGTSIYLSIGFASKAIVRNGTDVYNSMRFRSIEVISTLLISEGDIAALNEMDGILRAEPVWQAGAAVYRDGKKESASFITAGEQVNVPLILEGRLPEASNECAVEKSIAEKLNFHIGDMLDEFEMTDDAGQYFLGFEFTVTGIVQHPDHLSLTLPSSGYIIVTRDTFDLETLQGACMKAEVLLKDAESGSRFSDAYNKKVTAKIGEIEALALIQTPKTDAAVKAAGHAKIDAMEQATLDDIERAKNETPPDVDLIAYLESKLQSYVEYHDSIDNMDPCRWIVLGERGNTGFVQVLTCSETLRTIQINFALMFVLIGALTILATIGKMVNEQRTQVGTVKALGFYNREIIQKFLLFGVSATVIGAVIGSIIARYFMEGVALNNYSDSFAADLSAPLFDWVSVALVILAGTALSAGAVWVSCRRLIKESANALMQPAVPYVNRSEQAGKKHVLGLYARLILRNIRTDWKRVTLTIVCVLGCCAMIGVGFTLKNAINNCPKKQDSEVLHYDAIVKVMPSSIEDNQIILNETGADSIQLFKSDVLVQTEEVSLGQLICGDISEIQSMFSMLDWKTGEPLLPTDDGVYIYQRFAETAGVNVGSELKLTLGLSDAATVKVAGVFRNYLGLPIVMSCGYYESLFGKECEPNSLLVRLNGADKDVLIDKLEEEWGFESWTPYDGDRSAFEAATASINSVDALLIAIAAIMAGVVLLNLTDTYIMQKKRELTIMRINGFTVAELNGYLLRETVFTTAVGIILGVAAGCGIAYYIVRSVELSYTMFDRSVYLPAWLYAAGITALFAVVINAIALQKVKKLKLTDL